MKGSTRYKIRQLLVALFMGLVGPVTLLLVFNHPASLGVGTMLAGWGMAALFIWSSWQRRSTLWPWRYALSIAALLALIIQILPPWLHPSLTPAAYAQTTIQVNTAADEFDDVSVDDGNCSLREAIWAANNNSSARGCTRVGSGNDTITFNPTSITQTIVLTQAGIDENNNTTGDLDITDSVTIMGLNPVSTTIDGGDLDRVFHIRTNGTVEFENLTIQNGQSTGDGGGVFNELAATVNIRNVIIKNNDVTGLGEDGGGIANTGGGVINLTSSSVDSNRVRPTLSITDDAASGGGIFNIGGGSVSISSTVISKNEAKDLGGGIYNTQSLSIFDGTITQNSAGDSGGGIYNSFSAGIVNIEQSMISNNTATADGGGIYNTSTGDMTITGTIISDNTATRLGGGILNSSNGTLNVVQSTISGNRSLTSVGGGLSNRSGGQANLTQQTKILDNEAQTSGGGIYVNGASSQLIVENSELVGNKSMTAQGGGMANEGGTVIIRNSLISNNEALGTAGNSDGGGLANALETAMMTVTRSTISNNQAGDDGGGLSNGFSGTLTIETSTIISNTANDNGGGVFNTANGQDGSLINIIYSTIQNNMAADQGGGLFSDDTTVVEISTLSGNMAEEGGGVAVNFEFGDVHLNGVTVAENTATQPSGGGGGIFRGESAGGGSLTFQNSLIANNTATQPDCSDQGGGTPSPATLTSEGYNLVGNSTGCSGLDVDNDIVDVDPQIDSLADNNFSTQTHALQIGSPAIDAGNDATCKTTDQRQQNRVDQPGTGTALCDIGAFELVEVEGIPNASINNVQIEEGDAGSQLLTFEVTLTDDPPAPATIDFATADGTATVEDDDYQAISGTLTFETKDPQTFEVPINGDTVPEADETFTVILSNPTFVSIVDNEGQGSIINDDVGIFINDVEVAEGDEGFTDATLDVTLSLPGETEITVDYNTADGVAFDRVDYVHSEGSISFNPGETQKQITVQAIGDNRLDEGDRFFFINLKNPTGGASIVDGLGRVTIIEDDLTSSLNWIFLPAIVK